VKGSFLATKRRKRELTKEALSFSNRFWPTAFVLRGKADETLFCVFVYVCTCTPHAHMHIAAARVYRKKRVCFALTFARIKTVKRLIDSIERACSRTGQGGGAPTTAAVQHGRNERVNFPKQRNTCAALPLKKKEKKKGRRCGKETTDEKKISGALVPVASTLHNGTLHMPDP
jgi:hypothetical protein